MIEYLVPSKQDWTNFSIIDQLYVATGGEECKMPFKPIVRFDAIGPFLSCLYFIIQKTNYFQTKQRNKFNKNLTRLKTGFKKGKNDLEIDKYSLSNILDNNVDCFFLDISYF